MVVVDIIEYKMAGGKIEVLTILRQRAAEIGNLVGDLVVGILLADNLDEFGRNIYVL